MATVQTIIDRALRLNGVLGAGRTANANDTADCLIALNAMLESWRLERLMVYAMSTESLSLVAGTSSYTIGPSGDLNITRPIKIEDAYQRLDGIDFPVEIIPPERWNMIVDKTTDSDVVEMAYYNPTLETGNLQVWPVPTSAVTLYLMVREPISSFSAATDTVSLPPGYERALAYNLGFEISPEYGNGFSQAALEIARKSKAVIKKVNIPSSEVYPEIGRLFTTARSNIEAGE